MFGFTAHFVDEKIFIYSGVYQSNEILTAYLNIPSGELKNHLKHLYELRDEVQLLEGGDYDFCMNYDSNVQKAQQLFFRLGNIIRKLPPYNSNRELLDKLDSPLLTDCLNRYYYFWEDGIDEENEWVREDLDFCNEYGFVTLDSAGNREFYFHRFEPKPHNLDGYDGTVQLALERTNAATLKLFNAFITLTEDLVRVHTAYTELLNDFIHAKRKFLTDSETADCFVNYLFRSEKRQAYERVCSPGMMSINHEVHEGRLCDTYIFESLGAFLYIDFFRGLERSYIPRRCDNCGRYFLLTGGKYLNYCERPLKGEKGKTCRDVGSRRKYDDKCKNDPVWLAYNRAYKAHYARYMKKKMTTADFEQWSRYAVELRDKAENGSLEQAEYERLLKI